MADLSELIAAHRAAMAEYEGCTDDDWDAHKEGIGAKINASRDALLDHRPATLAEVRTKAAFMAADKAFALWDDIEPTALIHTLTPADGPTEIELLYKDWLAICAEGYGDVADEDEYFARYHALQQRIIGMEPSNVRDMAIQTYVDTDSGGSGHSDEFMEKIRKLVGGGADV